MNIRRKKRWMLYASRFVVPPGPTPTLVHDIERKRSTEGAIEQKRKNRLSGSPSNYHGPLYHPFNYYGLQVAFPVA